MADIFQLGIRQALRAPTDYPGNIPGTIVSRAETRASFERSWPLFSEACWTWLWDRRDAVLFEVVLFSLPLYRKRFRDLARWWTVAFGPCPFPWEAGPEPER